MRKKRKTKYDWAKVQEEYDAGLSWRGIQEKFGMVTSAISKAMKRGDFVPRTKSEGLRLHFEKNGPCSQTKETREKISVARLKYLENNPDKVPYLINHSSKESYPERIFRKALQSSGITGWVQEYQSGIYRYDFAFPDLKIDVEIDGSTHTSKKVQRIDERRDSWSKKNGWVVIRFPAKRVKEDVVSCINELKTYL